MIVKLGLASVVGTVLLTSVAFAQTSTPTARTDNAPSASSSTMQSHQGLWRASKLVGVNIYNDGGESLGKINDLIVDNSGAIKNVIIGVGGFLGVGERYIAVSFNKLKWVDEPIRTANTAPPAAGGMDSGRTVGSTANTPSSTSAPSPSSTAATARGDAWYPDHAVLSATKDDIKAMPEFKY